MSWLIYKIGLIRKKKLNHGSLLKSANNAKYLVNIKCVIIIFCVSAHHRVGEYRTLKGQILIV